MVQVFPVFSFSSFFFSRASSLVAAYTGLYPLQFLNGFNIYPNAIIFLSLFYGEGLPPAPLLVRM